MKFVVLYNGNLYTSQVITSLAYRTLVRANIEDVSFVDVSEDGTSKVVEEWATVRATAEAMVVLDDCLTTKGTQMIAELLNVNSDHIFNNLDKLKALLGISKDTNLAKTLLALHKADIYTLTEKVVNYI